MKKRSMIFVLMVIGVLFVSACVPTQTSTQSCEEAIQELHKEVEEAKACQVDNDCDFTSGNFEISDTSGPKYINIGYLINKQNLDEVSLKIQEIRNTACKGIPHLKAIRKLGEISCKNNKCDWV